MFVERVYKLSVHRRSQEGLQRIRGFLEGLYKMKTAPIPGTVSTSKSDKIEYGFGHTLIK